MKNIIIYLAIMLMVLIHSPFPMLTILCIISLTLPHLIGYLTIIDEEEIIKKKKKI